MREIASPTPSRKLADVLTELVELVGEQHTRPRWIPVDEHVPAGPHAVKGAIRRGELTAYRPGKTLLVRSDELDAWIEAHRVEPAKSDDADELDLVDQALADAGVRRAG
jgi:hypothetical protein